MPENTAAMPTQTWGKSYDLKNVWQIVNPQK